MMGSIWVDLLGSQVRYYGRRYRTRVIEAGSGEALVLIHGVGGHAEAYSRNVVRLGQEYRVLAIDLLWHGFSSKPPYEGQAVPTYAGQIVDLLDALGIERAHVEGESLGGWVALWFALHYPERLGKLILNTTAGVRYAAGSVDERPEEGTHLLRQRSIAAINDPTEETIRKRLEWLMASPDRVTDELVELRRRIYADPATRRALTDVFANSFGGGDSANYTLSEEMVRGVQAPTLVLWSDKNPGMGPDVGARLTSLIPGAQSYCMADAAHWPQWEHPEEHDAAVLRFLRG
jgi:pimeloyl-ACP methyl ester carboxylesterase